MQKMNIYLTHDEWKLVIASLNAHRNKLIAEGRSADFTDDVLLKTVTAPSPKVKIA